MVARCVPSHLRWAAVLFLTSGMTQWIVRAATGSTSQNAPVWVLIFYQLSFKKLNGVQYVGRSMYRWPMRYLAKGLLQCVISFKDIGWQLQLVQIYTRFDLVKHQYSVTVTMLISRTPFAYKLLRIPWYFQVLTADLHLRLCAFLKDKQTRSPHIES